MNLTCVCLVRRAEDTKVAMLYEIIGKKFALIFSHCVHLLKITNPK